ncbi:hypothetical protein WS70_14255 [Burkholderia mayonis]|uniref:DUF4377 domain-containing protein n=1 Tax=Burkholderia mayonis TaxID=1385591 RepID=A0A1B4FH20_9BURK|nr:hypothetical protein WS70_14255 [Burkholderia mayonis]KVE44278.1 hypothetical protein WS70_07345 [Burkholderia mayonis]KVE44986.1 hypothetical protein WS69_18885 [Burkholderia sp. BDU5]
MFSKIRHALAAVAFAVTAGLSGCETSTAANAPATQPAAPQAATKTVYVAAQTARCVGVAPMDCLQVRTSPNVPWQLRYSGTEGFDYRPDYEYQFEIAEYEVSNPPADGSSIHWVLKRIVRQQPR